MQWNDLSPYVMPYAPGCSVLVMVQHLQLAAIDFCRKTHCWQATLDSTDLPYTDANISRIKAVRLNGYPCTLLDAARGKTLAANGSQETFCYATSSRELVFNPALTATDTYQIDAVLLPLLDSTEIANEISEYAQDFALGAVASLTRMPNQVFTELNTSMAFAVDFKTRIASVSAKVSRSYLPSRIASSPGYV